MRPMLQLQLEVVLGQQQSREAIGRYPDMKSARRYGRARADLLELI